MVLAACMTGQENVTASVINDRNFDTTVGGVNEGPLSLADTDDLILRNDVNNRRIDCFVMPPPFIASRQHIFSDQRLSPRPF